MKPQEPEIGLLKERAYTIEFLKSKRHALLQRASLNPSFGKAELGLVDGVVPDQGLDHPHEEQSRSQESTDRDDQTSSHASLLHEAQFEATLSKAVKFSTSYYARRDEALAEACGHSYALLLEMQRLGKPAIDRGIELLKQRGRQRAPSEHKLALIATQITTNPRNKEEAKATSDLANVIKEAERDGIALGGFDTWFANTSIVKCKLKQRALRKELKPKLLATEPARHLEVENSQEADEIQLRITWKGGNQVICRRQFEITPLSAARNDKARPTSNLELTELLLSLAEAAEHTASGRKILPEEDR